MDDFPAPLGPSIPSTSFFATVKLMSTTLSPLDSPLVFLSFFLKGYVLHMVETLIWISLLISSPLSLTTGVVLST